MPDKLHLNFEDLIPEARSIQDGRFAFVEGEALKQNSALALQYVSFLQLLGDTYELPGGVKYNLYKTIILFTASIVEGLLVEKIKQLIAVGRVDPSGLFGSEEKYTNEKTLHSISSTEIIVGAKKAILLKEFPKDPKFQDFIRIAKRVSLFDDNLFTRADDLKKWRNRIHLNGLENVDDQYNKSDIEKAFSHAKLLIDRIRDF